MVVSPRRVHSATAGEIRLPLRGRQAAGACLWVCVCVSARFVDEHRGYEEERSHAFCPSTCEASAPSEQSYTRMCTKRTRIDTPPCTHTYRHILFHTTRSRRRFLRAKASSPLFSRRAWRLLPRARTGWPVPTNTTTGIPTHTLQRVLTHKSLHLLIHKHLQTFTRTSTYVHLLQALLACEGLESTLFETCMASLAKSADGVASPDEYHHGHSHSGLAPEGQSGGHLSLHMTTVGEWKCLRDGVCVCVGGCVCVRARALLW